MLSRTYVVRTLPLISLLCALPAIAGPLHEAAKKGDLNQVERLIEAGADINEADAVGRTPLHWAAEQGHAAVARLLIEKGAKVDTKERKGHYYRRTPLHLAAEDYSRCLGPPCKISPGLSEGKKAIVVVLVEHGADVNAEDRYGATALMSAAICNAVDVAQLLIDHGADMNHRADQYAVLEVASSRGPDVAISMIKRGAKVNTSDPQTKETPLHKAARCGFQELAEQLLLHGADVNARNQFRDTPLHKAASRDQREVVELLLQHGADVNAKNNRGRSPLDVTRDTIIIDTIKRHSDKPGQ